MHKKPASSNKHPGRSLLFLTNPTMILLGVLLLLFSWRVPTNIRIDVTVASSENLHSQPAVELFRSLRNQTLMMVEGQVGYRDFPDRAVIEFTSPERLEFSGEDMLVTIIEEERPASGQWRLRLDGLVSAAGIAAADGTTNDLRLTQFDRLKASPMLLWAGGGFWLLATVFGWIRVFQALNS